MMESGISNRNRLAPPTRSYRASSIVATYQPWWYSVVVSISGCDPLDPGSNPGTASKPFLFSVWCFVVDVIPSSPLWFFLVCHYPEQRASTSRDQCLAPTVTRPQEQQAVGNKTNSNSQARQKKDVAFGGTRTHANKVDYDLNVAP
jgi:hypothetical protein